MNLKEFLDIKSEEYNNTSFIENDPIQIPHKFKIKEDIEISGFLTATIAWGNRKSIINSSKRMMELLENDPHQFIICLLYTSPSPRDGLLSRMPSSA